MATHAQEQGASAGPEIETVIRAQLQDFTERDLDAAFGYATPNLQDFFGSPEVFGDMVANGFPMVWDNADARMIDRQNFDGVEVQLVQIEDATGGFHMLAYAMVQTDEGWRIDAVQIVPQPDVGV